MTSTKSFIICILFLFFPVLALFSQTDYRQEIVKLKNELAEKEMKVRSVQNDFEELKKSSLQTKAQLESKNAQIAALKNELKMVKKKSERDSLDAVLATIREEKMKLIVEENKKLYTESSNEYKTIIIEKQDNLSEVEQQLLETKKRLFERTFKISGAIKGNKGVPIPLDEQNSYKVKAKHITRITLEFDTGEKDIDLPIYFMSLSFNSIEVEKYKSAILPIHDGIANFEIPASSNFNFKRGIYTLTITYGQEGVRKTLKAYNFNLE